MTRTFDSVSVGDVIPAVQYSVRRSDLVRYAGASGDFNAIHWSQSAAEAVGLPGVIAHGMFTMATAGRLVSDWCGDPGAVREYGARFTSMVPVPAGEGATIEVAGTVGAKDDDARTVRVDLTATCAGTKVLGRASATVWLP